MSVSGATRASRATQIRRLAVGAARNPASVRFLPRLARSYGHTTLELRVPWLPFEVIDLLDEFVNRASEVFEFGGGGSTAWFADRAGRVVTVEDDPDWTALLHDAVRDRGNVELHAASKDNDHAEYVSWIDQYPDESFDVVVVDGRQRVRCFERAVPKVRTGGLLILDDADRQRYAPAFTAVNWPRTCYAGFAPCKDDIATTAIFVKP